MHESETIGRVPLLPIGWRCRALKIIVRIVMRERQRIGKCPTEACDASAGCPHDVDSTRPHVFDDTEMSAFGTSPEDWVQRDRSAFPAGVISSSIMPHATCCSGELLA